ncbi:MAG: tRNA uridine-5-carboxymethylaminomethyl(34) synthesis GTPase MnmE [Prevotellaceae bacterium]|jgi:tRNA modification GTPase|nr:tRNA uridine-5-carboxymethylaminomethyl(34) synthesis GTPase MnmE [Prevotellaceae bacterium]
MYHNNTICGISTAPGVGGIAVIRVSGAGAIAVVEQLFVPKTAERRLCAQKSHTLRFGHIANGKETVDEVLVSVFRAPHSFTGEETVEIACHGSHYIQQRILQLLLASGARMAEAGEFTRRAFLNGKLDLAQAEAVADLITAKSEAEHKVAMQQLRGGFSEELQQLRDRLLSFASLLELELDFSEEDVEFADRAQFNALLQEMQAVIRRLIRSFSLGNAIKNGVPVAIVGHTNVGKSTLLNALLNEDRALVSDIHGTTRDTIEDCIQLHGVLFRFIDTAGLRHTDETIEQLGIARTYEKLRQATLVLLLLDATRPETFSAIEEIRAQLNDTQQLIVAVNKVDLAACDIHSIPSPIYISAKNRQGMEALVEVLANHVNLSPISADETVVTNLRHYEALQRTQEALVRAAQGFANNTPGDLVAQEVREALHHLGSITGAISTDEILSTIFGKFCIGK